MTTSPQPFPKWIYFTISAAGVLLHHGLIWPEDLPMLKRQLEHGQILETGILH